MHKMFAIVAVVMALLVAGCPREQVPQQWGPKDALKSGEGLKLNFTVGDKASYHVASESSKTATYEGPLLSNEPMLKDKSGKTGVMVEMGYEQEVLDILPEGAGLVQITVKSLKYHQVPQNETSLKFDSSADAGQPLAGVIGKSYNIRMFPNGVAEIVDAAQIRNAAGAGAAKQIASQLFSDEEIVRRHTIASLPADSPKKAHGQTWSAVAPAPRGMVDTRPFERVYTLTGVARENDRSVATITMEASPAAQAGPAGDTRNNMFIAAFGAMMDRQDNYTGLTQIDVRSGALLRYEDHLETGWIATDPEVKPDQEPDRIIMIFIQKQTVEKID